MCLKSPIFIVGPGRSGTTLIRSLLSAHSRICVAPETHFMARAEQWGLPQRGAPESFQQFWKVYVESGRFQDLGVDPERCRELIESRGASTFQNIFRAILAAYKERLGKPRVGEKTPGHTRFLPQLLNWFPDARVLVTQRDPRAVTASQLKTAYVQARLTPTSLRHGILKDSRSRDVAFFADHWASIYENHLTPYRDDFRFHRIVYESLVSYPEREVRAICDFLEEPFEPEMITARNAVGVHIPEAQYGGERMERWRRDHYQKSLAPISAESLNKWRDDLTPMEVAMVEARCHRLMRVFGYTNTTSGSRRTVGRAMFNACLRGAAAEGTARAAAKSGVRLLHKAKKLVASGVKRGLPPAWFGYRHVIRETVRDYFLRHVDDPGAGRYETVHPEAVAENPLPRNVPSRDDLPADRGWWGYSFHDVPRRTSGETFIATLPGCLITWYRDPEMSDDFYPAILNRDIRALDMREVRFRPLHAATLRTSEPPARLKKATWFIERVYHNHSHWLTAHLPKLLLLRERGMLGDVLLPPERTAAMDGTMRMLGLKPEQFPTFDPTRPLFVEELTILGTDRFRPELLQMIPAAFGVTGVDTPHRKIFISRLKATRRRLVNEDDIWSLLEPLGFERVLMEEMTLAAQVQLMRETAVLVAPHGAGLTNMVFCPPGAYIVELADPSFPNPNFYALASALGHPYWLISAESLGDVHPLEKDLRVDPAAVRHILPALISPSGAKTSETL